MIRTLKRKTPLRPRRKTRKGQVSRHVLTALWGKVILARDLSCVFVRAGMDLGPDVYRCAGKFEPAHMYSKQAYPQIRWDLGNGNALCTKHHFFVHQNPIMANRLYEAIWGRKHLDSLWIRAIANGKVDRAAVREHLKTQLALLEPLE